MGFKLKIKAPKLSTPKVAALLANPTAVASTLAVSQNKDVQAAAGGQAKLMGGVLTGNLGMAGEGANQIGTAFGQATGLVKRPGDLPDVAGTLSTAGTEPPSASAITEDQNDQQRKELGRRFASRQLFGGGGLMNTVTRSSSLLGF